MKKIKYRMCLFKTFQVILSYLLDTHITYIILKHNKKTNTNIFLTIFFLYIKMTNNNY